MQPPPAQQQSSQFGGRINTGPPPPPPQHFNNQPPPNFNNAYTSGAQSAAAVAAAAGQPPPPPPPPSHNSGPNGGQEQRSFAGPNTYSHYGHSNTRYNDHGTHGGTGSGPQSGVPSGHSGGGGPGGRNEGRPNHVLLITVINPAYPINCDVIYQICSPQGKVLRIVIFKKNGVQAMVEFDSVESAKRAKLALNGCDIYSGCCTLKVEFAKVITK